MNKNTPIERQILNVVVRTAGFLVILIVLSGDIRILWSYLFGLTIGILMFIRMASTAKKALGLSKDKVKRYRVGQYLIRYIVYGAALWAAYTREYFSFGGAVLGLLTIKIGLVGWALWRTVNNFYVSKFKPYLEPDKSEKKGGEEL